ncbi:MAG: WD40/YVTN/BNR-like repeat-containing protein [Planctomycetota bacterium]|jgi:photosystem II stability/assembly factor-like uncharacterized protein
MSRFICMVGLSVVLTGCHTGQVHKMKYGPPPPGYIKIRGEAVPGWKPADMIADPRGADRTLSWSPLGPRPITDEYWSGSDDASGRVVSVAVHPDDPDTVYIASASGGVWKTSDGGVLWTPLTDELATLNHGCVTLDPSNPDTVYVGTGEYTTATSGAGLFRSTDAGATWIQISTAAQVGSTCSRVIVDPSDPLRIHLTGNDGYVRTTDGGATWTNYLSGSASDLALDPEYPQRLYVGRHGDGIYRSTNGGTTWTKLTSGLPSSNVHRIILGMAGEGQATIGPTPLYAAIINGGAGLRGMYKTTNGGSSWTELANTPDFPYPQGWYDACVAVDPTDESVVYAGGVFPSYAVAGVIKSTDGGASWTDITVGTGGGQLHPDQHAITFGPDGTVWVGNDGGVWKSVDGGESWINTNETLAVTQIYNIALHPSDPGRVMGGTQDNGTAGREIDPEDWPQIIGGDGGFLAYDFAEPFRKYTTYVYLAVFRFVNSTWTDITGPWGGDPANFIAPLVMDPNDPHNLVGGTNRVWRTTNAHTAANWSAISTSVVADGGRLNAIAVAEGASDTIYTGCTTGKVYLTTNAALWLNRSNGLPGGQISDIVIDPSDQGTAYVSFYNTTGPRVLRTTNYGLSWANVTGDMPTGVSSRALAVDWRFDPPHLHSGSGVGVYSSSDGGVTWIKDGLDLPNVNIGDLAIDTVENTLTAGTYGRGAWRTDLPQPEVPGDIDGDGDVDLDDHAILQSCLSGPNVTFPPTGCSVEEFADADQDSDADVDLGDFGSFTRHLTP